MRLSLLLLLLGAGCGGPNGNPSHEALGKELGALLQGGRPTEATAAPPRFEPGEQVESMVSPGGLFRLHFSRSGPNAVTVADVDGNGVPDSVDTVARTYDAVAVFYSGMGYRLPPRDSGGTGEHGGDERFDVYLVDFAGRADGAFRVEGCLTTDLGCSGYMLQENDFAGYGYPSHEHAVATLASHEFFHAVQAAYRTGLGRMAEEGTAVWASEHFAPELDDLERAAPAYLSHADRSLVVEPDGPAQSFSYGASLFFQFLSERLGEGVVLSMWEESVHAPSARWPTLLETVLRRDWGMDFDTTFSEFAQWNLATGESAREGSGYARGADYSGLVLAARELPVDEPAVRVAAASTRYFEVPGGTESVSASFDPREGTESAALHLLVAAVNEHEVLRIVRADGPGHLSAQVSARDATHVVVAMVNGRPEGDGRYGRLRISSRSPHEDPSGGCQIAPGALPWALLLTATVWRRSPRRRTTRRVPP
ncbi:MXAN_6640 family putative metalloprotease [Archangium lipolyticum]|uniref:MXAN_6640 family putative metalloprotease n=1 Tax=Archangium lipolyticum TaxID=2970465 RepID=UPI00214A7343|nr:MXAN_6640 family putative metalloprotease [Archangium lipolyticum]